MFFWLARTPTAENPWINCVAVACATEAAPAAITAREISSAGAAVAWPGKNASAARIMARSAAIDDRRGLSFSEVQFIRLGGFLCRYCTAVLSEYRDGADLKRSPKRR